MKNANLFQSLKKILFTTVFKENPLRLLTNHFDLIFLYAVFCLHQPNLLIVNSGSKQLIFEYLKNEMWFDL